MGTPGDDCGCGCCSVLYLEVLEQNIRGVCVCVWQPWLKKTFTLLSTMRVLWAQCTRMGCRKLMHISEPFVFVALLFTAGWHQQSALLRSLSCLLLCWLHNPVKKWTLWVPHCFVQAFIVMENIFVGKCTSVMSNTSPPFIMVWNLVSAEEGTISNAALLLSLCYLCMLYPTALNVSAQTQHQWKSWLHSLYLPVDFEYLFTSPVWLILRFKDLVCLVTESTLDCDDVKDFSAAC